MNDQQIKAATTGSILRDDQVRGLHLRVFDKRRSWYLYYATKAGQERRPKLGDWPSLSLASARRAARELLEQVAMGRDPGAEWQAERTAPTMAKLWDWYAENHAALKDSAAEDLRMWRNYIEPKLGTRLVKSVAFEDISDLHRSMRATPYQANRVLALLSKMFSLAYRPLKWVESKPTDGVKRYVERKRRRHMGPDEATRLAALFRQYEEQYPAAIAFIWMLVLTGARKGEIANARWTDLQGSKLVLERHKTDGSGEPRTIYLPAQVMAILDHLPRTTGTITGIKDPKWLWERMRVEAGCPDLRLHDLRRSFASAALSAGYTLAQVGELLGHASTQTTKGYAYLMEDAAAAAVTGVADAIERRMAAPTSPAIAGSSCADSPVPG